MEGTRTSRSRRVSSPCSPTGGPRCLPSGFCGREGWGGGRGRSDPTTCLKGSSCSSSGGPATSTLEHLPSTSAVVAEPKGPDRDVDPLGVQWNWRPRGTRTAGETPTYSFPPSSHRPSPTHTPRPQFPGTPPDPSPVVPGTYGSTSVGEVFVGQVSLHPCRRRP